jgi:hypothetical protein
MGTSDDFDAAASGLIENSETENTTPFTTSLRFGPRSDLYAAALDNQST